MQVSNCRLCQSPLGQIVLDLGYTPLANEFVPKPEYQDVFPLQICCCTSCGHYQLNQNIDPERLFRTYYYVAGTSPVNVEHFRQYAVSVVEKFNLKPGSKVLDIASNDGTLLQHFKDLGMKVLGIDPAQNIATEANKKGIETIPEFFTEAYADKMLEQYGQFDLITANNVFAHCIDFPDFAKGVKKLLAPQGVFAFEVSYFADVCDHTVFDTIYHEHSDYHTIKPLLFFFERHGLDLFDVERIPNHGGSIRVFVKHWQEMTRNGIYPTRSDDWKSCVKQEAEIEKKVEILSKSINRLGAELREQLTSFIDQGKSIAIYGVPAKATTLMYALGINRDWIDFAVDDAPLKQGTYTPGKHIPVYPTKSILEYEPDIILVLAWNFAESIIARVQKLWEDNHPFYGKYRYPTFIIPLPELKVQRYCEDKTCTCGEGPWNKQNHLSGSLISAYKCQACGGMDYALETKNVPV
jgi:SAM-dependent methyltransferase